MWGGDEVMPRSNCRRCSESKAACLRWWEWRCRAYNIMSSKTNTSAHTSAHIAAGSKPCYIRTECC
jgi:hypothetical protein